LNNQIRRRLAQRHINYTFVHKYNIAILAEIDKEKGSGGMGLLLEKSWYNLKAYKGMTEAECPVVPHIKIKPKEPLTSTYKHCILLSRSIYGGCNCKYLFSGRFVGSN
jgi:hypothetical protein